MATPAPPPRWLSWMPALSLLVVVVGAVGTGGGYVGQVTDHNRRIAAMETLVDRRDEQLRAIDLRLARIEVKLEMLDPRTKDVTP
ncbi:hypothetical protein U1737_04755 [Sphingomonas sp. LB3N6]|uniref:hypothetical protein n=1 Tax=Sphingomonas fucosidasi TaxID=3096164 RepID=UPI002FC7360A